MLLITSLLHDWCRFLRCISYILYFRDGGISPGIIILLSDDRVFSYYYLPKVRLLLIHKFLEPIILSYGLSLNFLRRFVDFSGIHFISGYNRMSILLLVFLFNSDLSAGVLLLNYLLAGLPSRVQMFANLCISAYRPLFSLITLMQFALFLFVLKP